VPPFAGFFSKLFIIIGAVAARMYWLAILAALFSTVTLGYLVGVVNRVFFVRKDREPTPAREVPALMVIAMLVLAAMTVALGIGFKQMLDKLVGPAAQSLIQGLGYARAVLGG
jgi:multicomponent Na+:H+ antiporter subunit D